MEKVCVGHRSTHSHPSHAHALLIWDWNSRKFCGGRSLPNNVSGMLIFLFASPRNCQAPSRKSFFVFLCLLIRRRKEDELGDRETLLFGWQQQELINCRNVLISFAQNIAEPSPPPARSEKLIDKVHYQIMFCSSDLQRNPITRWVSCLSALFPKLVLQKIKILGLKNSVSQSVCHASSQFYIPLTFMPNERHTQAKPESGHWKTSAIATN